MFSHFTSLVWVYGEQCWSHTINSESPSLPTSLPPSLGLPPYTLRVVHPIPAELFLASETFIVLASIAITYDRLKRMACLYIGKLPMSKELRGHKRMKR
eukprot:1090496-Amphidinium_carterae.2